MLPETAPTEHGALKGVRTADGAVMSYKGVPFARPPIGELRWRPPQAPDRWDGVRPADAFAAHAMQPPTRDPVVGDTFGENGSYGAMSEDCLYLNVWTAAQDPDERRPVMVWLHHGAFRYGGPGVPAYDGENLARAGVVVVTISYRLGRIGFLAHPALSAESEHSASSNYGLLDQLRALEWVQGNIAQFGGNPGCVTIFGLSAGSASVNVLMASPRSTGLFHRAIGESGGLMPPAGPTTGRGDRVQTLKGAEETGLALQRELGAASIDELRRRPAREILGVPPTKLFAKVATEPIAWTRDGAPVPPGSLDLSYPVLDGYVLTEAPSDVFREGAQRDVPLLAGSSARENASLPYVLDLADFERDARAEYGDAADRFLALFEADESTVREVSGVSRGDRVFVWQNWAWTRAHARTGTSACFYYHWNHVPPIRTDAEFAQKMKGAYHGVELPYVWRNLQTRDWPWTTFDRSLSETASSYWLNFAATGDPNGDGLPRWSRFDPDAPHAMRFGDPVGMTDVPRREQLEFWDDWYDAARADDSALKTR